MTTADIAIIGGGVAGLSLAAALAGRASTVVLETEPQPFHHASGRSAQQMQPTYGPAPVRALTAASIPMVDRLGRRIGRAVFTPRPLLWLSQEDERGRFDHLLRTVPGLVEIGADAAAGLLPVLRRDRIADAAIDRAAKEVDVPALLAAYREDALAGGAQLLVRSPARRVERRGDRWRIGLDDGVVEAATVVDAAGAWADDIARLAGAAPRRLVPRRRTVAVARPRDGAVDPAWPMAADVADRWYFRPRGDAVLACPLEDEASVPEDASPRPDVVREAIRRVNRVTRLHLGTPVESWTGLRTVAPDGLPVVGRDPEVPGFYWLAGQAGFGIQTSAALAAVVAADLLGEEHGLDGVAGVLAEVGPRRPALAA